jgi:hypothetical protein
MQVMVVKLHHLLLKLFDRGISERIKALFPPEECTETIFKKLSFVPL